MIRSPISVGNQGVTNAEYRRRCSACMGTVFRRATAYFVIYNFTDQQYAGVFLSNAEQSAQLKTVAVFDADTAKCVGLERQEPTAEDRLLFERDRSQHKRGAG